MWLKRPSEEAFFGQRSCSHMSLMQLYHFDLFILFIYLPEGVLGL